MIRTKIQNLLRSPCHCEERSDEPISKATRLPRTLRVLATTYGKKEGFDIEAFGLCLAFGFWNLDFERGNA
jgi:hypothetical protein